MVTRPHHDTARWWHRRPGAALLPVLVIVVLAMSGGIIGATPLPAGQLGPDDLPVSTVFNEFYPEDRDLSDCLSVLPKPGCGSDARSGWPQLVVFALILLGVGVVVARVMVSSRRSRTGTRTGDVDATP